MPTTIKAQELASIAGRELEPSEWLQITQDRVNQFADATNDHQFIHVDAEKAAQTPLGGTIAHGFLSLSLLTYLTSQNALLPDNLAMILNYGSDRVRYLAPVRVGKRIRARQTIADASEKQPGRWLIRTNVTVEIEGEDTPALIAETLMMYILEA